MKRFNSIKEFYSSEEFLNLIPNTIKFHHLRFKDQDGIWKKVPFKINSKKKLQDWILKLEGVDLYFGTSQWYNPHKVSLKGRSGTYMVADNLLLGNYFIFDVDVEEPVTLEKLDVGRQSTNNIYEGMKLLNKEFGEGFKFDSFSFTGLKGFRLIYKDTTTKLPFKASDRIKYLEDKRKIYIDRLLEIIKENRSRQQFYNIETFFDRKVTENIMGVIHLL
jgi:hypothetical protein